MVLGVNIARFCIFIVKNCQLRESTYNGATKQNSTLKTKKGILHEEECPILIFIPYIIYSINITRQPEQLHDGCKKQESNP